MSVEPKRHVPTLSLNLALEAKFPDPFGATFSCPIILIVRNNLNTRFYFVAIMSFSFISLKKVRKKKGIIFQDISSVWKLQGTRVWKR